MASDIPQALRQQVAERAKFACEYCLIHEDDSGYPHQVDHIRSRKHGGDSSFENLAFACVFCNRYKGSDIATVDPVTGTAVRLFDPRQDSWVDHFEWNDSHGMEAKSAIAQATIRLLRLNAIERIAERSCLHSPEQQHSVQPAESK